MGGSDRAGGARFSVAMADVVRAVGEAERWEYQGCRRAHVRFRRKRGRLRMSTGGQGTAWHGTARRQQQNSSSRSEGGLVGLDLNLDLDLDLEKRALNASAG
jgi:hypothetical protein